MNGEAGWKRPAFSVCVKPLAGGDAPAITPCPNSRGAGVLHMKATIERATLLKGLAHVQSVVERRNTIPILSNVLIDGTGASGGAGLRLMATDLDLQINEV